MQLGTVVSNYAHNDGLPWTESELFECAGLSVRSNQREHRAAVLRAPYILAKWVWSIIGWRRSSKPLAMV